MVKVRHTMLKVQFLSKKYVLTKQTFRFSSRFWPQKKSKKMLLFLSKWVFGQNMDFWNNVGRPTAYKKKMVVRNIAKISDCSNALSAPYIVGVTNIQSGKMATLKVSSHAFTFFCLIHFPDV